MTTIAVLTSYVFLDRHYGDIQSSSCTHFLSAYSPGLRPFLPPLFRVMPPKANLLLLEILPMLHWACSPLLQQAKESNSVLWVMAGMEKWTAGAFSSVQPPALHPPPGTPNKHATSIQNSFTLLCKQSLNKNLSFVLPSKSPLSRT